jgi:hypothetical protein
LAVFFAFFAFFAFLAMMPSVIPNVWLNASRQSTGIDSDYTKIAKLILRGSNKVNGRHAEASASCCCGLGVFQNSRNKFEQTITSISFGVALCV